ncbi:hypothetical protein TTHERM_00122450 (macronuclear) [Tetrahymena thermophila SB210]|uniref:Uncharacterized protein n=1 Tax=Tetrahymena thermophila (strain SB210) TaxID=312017 RepID=Q22YS5_TETTS|nr:hypothetical protein TTHERM_00122450 [Tetrahymena thermophila SB210]EAR90596.1 hypothetical protein TTHERM_00122450 [Tetrahymena thermophila SB210]|eukprot:XP_001010841.1 hypothetical protein TTHERM_00122450 [Tetrahymena thermophila SB210]
MKIIQDINNQPLDFNNNDNNNLNLIDIFLELVDEQDSGSQISSGSYEECLDITKLFQEVRKSNIVKNIIKSFSRFIETCKKEEEDSLNPLIKKGQSFSQAKKLIKRNFKTFGKRWNMKLNYLIDKSSFKPLFSYYLNNKSQIWLNSSKVQNKQEHQVVINFIIQALKNPQHLKEIKYYKKTKSIIKDKKKI